ncbi:MAG: hypothetical protein IJX53_06305 [Clostridia bacterium]|nr:hypothetical protein [Clostridia bacterium]
MTHSLLYAPGRVPEAAPRADESILTALSLDRALTIILPDVGERRYVSALLAAPLSDAGDITYRQAVMRNFLDHPAMLPAWQTLFGRLLELRRAYEEDRRQRISATARAREAALFGEAKSRLQMAALTLKRLLLLIGEMHERLSGYPVSAEGLRTVTARLADLARAEATAELIERCGMLTDLSSFASYRFALAIDADGRITGRTYLDRADKPTQAAEPPRRRFFAPRKTEETAPRKVTIDAAFPALRRQLIGQGLTEAALTLERICSALFAELCPLARELIFYAAGVRFAACFAERGLPTALPVIADDGTISGTGLYDPFLAATMLGGGAIIPNDFTMPGDTPGVLVTGANNSGKTVFLRSVGSAILLGQAGFPVCAASTVITPVRTVTSVFAAAEKADGVGSEAGRFEEEVRLLSDAVDRAAPGELILLNEPFQTTAYGEGAEGLAAILRYLQARGTRWVLVTHLDALPPLVGGALRMVSREDHRVVAI